MESSYSESDRPRISPHIWGIVELQPGERIEVSLDVTESYSSLNIPIPVVVERGEHDGPTLFITAAIHGDEINGTGAIRSLIADHNWKLKRGTLILVPVVNILGFDRHTRYLPDRRDLNRCFPGNPEGSLAARMARIIYDEIVRRSDYGIDLHTAAIRRTNFPCIRAEMNNPRTARLAELFGSQIILNQEGPAGSFRREASAGGCSTILLEAGEVWKVEPAIVEFAVRGILSVLAGLDMIEGEVQKPHSRVTINQSRWMRASRGGFLRFHCSPGEFVREGDPLATNTSITGVENNVITAPFDAVILGMTTLPCIAPGDPICHLGRLEKQHKSIDWIQKRMSVDTLHGRMVEHLSTNVRVVNPGNSSQSTDNVDSSTEREA
ncbi:MAG: succinylglutamate desuccinylase/aspartoacylase family protein [Planctomycetaceae bacterium]|nr:succinylglutamate desuccinylase/aspartoacylase family protein [Planctomycetaceae bacterium]